MSFYLTLSHVQAVQGLLGSVALPMAAPQVQPVLDEARTILGQVDTVDQNSVALMRCRFQTGDHAPSVFFRLRERQPASFKRLRTAERFGNFGFLVIPRASEGIISPARMRMDGKIHLSTKSQRMPDEMIDTIDSAVCRPDSAPPPDIVSVFFSRYSAGSAPVLSAMLFARILGSWHEYAAVEEMQHSMPRPLAQMTGIRSVWQPPANLRRLFMALDMPIEYLEISLQSKGSLRAAGITYVGDAVQKTREVFLEALGGDSGYLAEFETVLASPLGEIAKRPLRLGMAESDLEGWSPPPGVHEPLPDGAEPLNAGQVAAALRALERMAGPRRGMK